MNRKLSFTILLTIALLIYLIVVSHPNAQSGALILSNGKISLEFSPETFSLLRIRDLSTGKSYEFVNSSLWRVTFLNKRAIYSNLGKGLFEYMTSDDPSLDKEYHLRNSSNGTILEMSWATKRHVKVYVKIELPKRSNISVWRISVENGGEDAIWSVDFPYIRMKPTHGDKKDTILAIPLHSGVLIRDPMDNIHWKIQPWEEVRHDQDKGGIDERGAYPGGYNAQFAAVYSSSEGDGVYIASYDGRMYSKRFLFCGDGGSLLINIRNYPDRMLTPGIDYTIPYPIVVGVFHGDWMDAADIYREWAVHQEWCKEGPMYKRDDLSRAMYDTDVTVIAAYKVDLDSPNHYKEIKEDLLNMKAFFNTYSSVNGSSPSIGVHWIGWSKHLDVIGEQGTPNYFPAQENFSRLIDELHSVGGFYCDVYLGTGVFDSANPIWRDDEYAWEEARPYACYNPLNQTYKKFKPTYAWMDPSQEWWQDVLRSLAIRAQREVHIDGTYWDHYPKFRLEFRHHEGGGNFYALGYRKMMMKIKEATRASDPNHYICPEGKSEIEVGIFDAMLSEFFHSDAEGRLHSFGFVGIPAPIIPYLYHDYITQVGGIRVKNKDFTSFKNPLEFRAIEAILWVWGNKPHYPFVDGRKSNAYVFTLWKEKELDPLWENNLKYLANLVKMYKVGKDALLFGRMLRPPMLEGVGSEVVNLNGKLVKVPSVVDGAFKAPDGRILIPITNWGEKDETIRSLNFSKCKWLNGKYMLSVLTNAKERPVGTFKGKIARVNLRISKEEALFVVIRLGAS